MDKQQQLTRTHTNTNHHHRHQHQQRYIACLGTHATLVRLVLSQREPTTTDIVTGLSHSYGTVSNGTYRHRLPRSYRRPMCCLSRDRAICISTWLDSTTIASPAPLPSPLVTMTTSKGTSPVSRRQTQERNASNRQTAKRRERKSNQGMHRSMGSQQDTDRKRLCQGHRLWGTRRQQSREGMASIRR